MFYTDAAGLLSIEVGPWCLHLLPRKGHRFWGREDNDWCTYWGAGRVVMLARVWA